MRKQEEEIQKEIDILKKFEAKTPYIIILVCLTSLMELSWVIGVWFG